MKKGGIVVVDQDPGSIGGGPEAEAEIGEGRVVQGKYTNFEIKLVN